MKKSAHLIAISAWIVLSGCSSASKLARLQQGMTTTETLAVLGEPSGRTQRTPNEKRFTFNGADQSFAIIRNEKLSHWGTFRSIGSMEVFVDSRTEGTISDLQGKKVFIVSGRNDVSSDELIFKQDIAPPLAAWIALVGGTQTENKESADIVMSIGWSGDDKSFSQSTFYSAYGGRVVEEYISRVTRYVHRMWIDALSAPDLKQKKNVYLWQAYAATTGTSPDTTEYMAWLLAGATDYIGNGRKKAEVKVYENDPALQYYSGYSIPNEYVLTR